MAARATALSIPLTVAAPRTNLSLFAMIASDLVSLFVANALIVVLRWMLSGEYELGLYVRLWPMLGLFGIIYSAFGLYPGIAVSTVVEIRKTTLATTLVFLTLGALTFMLRDAGEYSRSVFVIAWLTSLVMIPVARAMVRERLSREPWWGYPVVVFGAGEIGKKVVHTLRRDRGLGLRPVAVFDDLAPWGQFLEDVPVLGGLERAPAFARVHGITRAIVAMPSVSSANLVSLLETYAYAFPHLTIVPDLFGVGSLWIETRDLCRMLTLEIKKSLLLPAPRIVKRTMDFALAISIGICALPLLALIALAVRIDSRGPLFFGHSRIGRDKRCFKLWKFRTMCVNSDQVLADHLRANPASADEWRREHKLKHDPRITRVGTFLRKTSLDELPQFWNIFWGEMSLVGPRPIVAREVEKYGKQFPLYTRVAPGLTGLWQVSGRNDTTYRERVELDSWYVRNWSPWLDIYILARTPGAVWKGHGAY